MSRKRRFEERCFGGLLAVVTAGLVLVPTAEGQPSDNVTIDVSDCVALEKPGERLDCFERQLEAERQRAAAASRSPPAPAASAPAVPTSPAPAPVASPRETARTATPDAVETIRGRRGREEPAEQPNQELVAVVTDLRETVPNTWLITLDNGQVWRQSPPKFYPLRQGHEVRLYPTGWGPSYRLTVAELRGFIQVERVR